MRALANYSLVGILNIMEQNILSGVLALSLVLLNPSGNSSTQFTSQTIVKEEMRDYLVKEGDTISVIAEKEYGSRDFWINIWAENPWIENPDLIEKDWKLKLSDNKPTSVSTLSSDLKEKLKKQTKVVAVLPDPTQPQAQTTTQAVNMVSAVTTIGGPLNEAQITFLGNCESGMTAGRNSGNGYYGAFQFSIGTWNSMGTGYERADLAPLEVQVGAVQRLLSRSSIFTQFPGCARKMQSLGLI